MARTQHHGRARLEREPDGSITLRLDVRAIERAEGGGLRERGRTGRTVRRLARRVRALAAHGDERRAARIARRAAKGGA